MNTYIGIDLTDRHARDPRPNDICAIVEIDGGLSTYFDTWTWPASTRDVSTLLTVVRAARVVAIDGPQGLAEAGARMRACERELGTPGKTGDSRPDASQPYAGYLASSLDLYGSLHAAGVDIGAPSLLGVQEVFPGASWNRLFRALDPKGTRSGRVQRTCILAELGIRLSGLPTHDQLDACVSALIGAAVDGHVPGLSILSVGRRVRWDPAVESLREGTILVPEVDETLARRLSDAIRRSVDPRDSVPSRTTAATPDSPDVRPNAHAEPFAPERLDVPADETDRGRAMALFQELVAGVRGGKPRTVSYREAYDRVFIPPATALTPAHVQKLLRLAVSLEPVDVPSLGPVKLDTFIVSAISDLPGEGHWVSAPYTKDQWLAVFRGGGTSQPGGSGLVQLNHLAIDAGRLMRDHPPRLHHPHKRLVFDVACPPGVTHTGELNCSRWSPAPLPAEWRPSESQTSIEFRSGFYDYRPALGGADVVEWHVNFADPDLFFAHGGPLFAQDEIQTAEHPALGALREALLARGLAAATVEGGQPTPVLVRGVERRCRVATDRNPTEGRPDGLYGNAFARASADVVRRATSRIDPPTITNIIAMAAPAHGKGRYSHAEIEYILTTAFTGFSAAARESAAAPAVVHTGFWGCGAFGGNRVLMTLLQLVAARMAGIRVLVFHAAGEPERAVFDRAAAVLADELESETSTTGPLIQRIADLGFEWGQSDGN